MLFHLRLLDTRCSLLLDSGCEPPDRALLHVWKCVILRGAHTKELWFFSINEAQDRCLKPQVTNTCLCAKMTSQNCLKMSVLERWLSGRGSKWWFPALMSGGTQGIQSLWPLWHLCLWTFNTLSICIHMDKIIFKSYNLFQVSICRKTKCKMLHGIA